MIKSTNYKEQAPKTATVAGVELADRNNERVSLILFNQGPETAQISFGSEPTNYIELEPNKAMHFPRVPKNQVNAKTTTGTAVISVLEA